MNKRLNNKIILVIKKNKNYCNKLRVMRRWKRVRETNINKAWNNNQQQQQQQQQHQQQQQQQQQQQKKQQQQQRYQRRC